VLAPENTGKMDNRWLGPGTVVRVKSPYSYLVDLGNGNIRHMHANKMRHFIYSSYAVYFAKAGCCELSTVIERR